PVAVMLTATPGSSPVSATYYTLDGGTPYAYGGPFPISTDGIHQLSFYSVDTAGKQETPHGEAIKIDQTPPAISGMPAVNCILWPPNHQMVQVASVTAADATSGLVPGSFHVTGASNQPPNPKELDLRIVPNGSGGFTVQLRADRLGNGEDRIY